MKANDLSEYSVLVVDDDEFARDVIVGMLGRVGCKRTFEAQDADSACKIAQRERPDFVLLDIYMPDVDGWALLERLRRLLPNVVAVMVTGSNLPADFEKSLGQRVDGFCIKPVLPDIMLKTLQRARQRRLGVN